MDVNISNLTVKFDSHRVLDNISLHVKNREFISILGKSGCGKTVLLNSIIGTQQIADGVITIDGNQSKKPNRNLGIVFQDFCILPWMTIKENILLGSKDEKMLLKFAEIFKISEHLDKIPKETSIGTRQRAAICRAILSNSPLILMDEPLCSVDALTADLIRQEMKDHLQDRTVILVTHDIDEALFLSSRIICLKNSKISLDLEKGECTKNKILSAI